MQVSFTECPKPSFCVITKMVHNSTSENPLVHNGRMSSTYKDKRHKAENFKKRLAKIAGIINSLETSILQSNENDRELLMVVQRDNLRNQKLTHQLDEARKENKLLLSTLQLEGDGGDLSKCRGQAEYLSSYSTISIVHLQYKYDELLSSHEGLLKVLESKVKETQKCYRENDELRDEIQNLLQQISDNKNIITTLCEKYLKLKERKDNKILSLKYEKDTLRLAHNQVVNLLNEECLLDDDVCCSEQQKTFRSTTSLLLKEANLCNELQHENLKLLRENEILKAQIRYLNKTSSENK